MKIQSISDIITNSSTEVFIVYNEDVIKDIKRLVNGILSLTSDKTFDDYFEIKMIYNMDNIYDVAEDYIYFHKSLFNVTLKDWEDSPDREELIRDLIKNNEDFFKEIECFENPYMGYEVTAKCPEADKVANIITDIPNMFELDYFDNW